MTCKLESSEKAMRQSLRYMKSIINKMLNKRIYPDSFSFETGFEEVMVELWGGKEILDNGMRTITFKYHAPTLKKGKKK